MADDMQKNTSLVTPASNVIAGLDVAGNRFKNVDGDMTSFRVVEPRPDDETISRERCQHDAA